MTGIVDRFGYFAGPAADGAPSAAHPAAGADDHVVARTLAVDAGRLLVELREQMISDGSTDRAIKDAGDLRSHQFLMEQLRQLRPDDGILSEEGRDDHARLESSRVWIVDPLDGTREYGEARRDWAVHVALAIDGVPAIGAVSLPSLGLVLDTGTPPVVPPRPEGSPGAARREPQSTAHALDGHRQRAPR